MKTEILTQLENATSSGDLDKIIYGRAVEGLEKDICLAVQACAVPEGFDASLAQEIFAGPAGLNGKSGKAFNEVTSLPFIYRRRSGDWEFSPGARMFFLNQLKTSGSDILKKTNQTVADYFDEESKSKSLSTDRKLSFQFRKATHTINVDREKGFNEIDKIIEEKIPEQEAKNQVSYAVFQLCEKFDPIYEYGKENYYYYEGMRLYMAGKKQEALPYLKPVADSDLVNRRVAIACHLVGQILARDHYKTRDKVEAYYKKSLDIGKKIPDKIIQAQVLHSLGNLLANDRNRHRAAEEYLNESLKLREIDDKYGKAQVLHSLGDLLAKDSDRFEEAEKAYWQSIDIHDAPNHRKGVYTSLASFYRERSLYRKAEEMINECFKILDKLPYEDKKAKIICYNEQGRIAYALGRFDDAINFYKKVLGIERNKKFIASTEKFIRETKKEKEKIETARSALLKEGKSALKNLSPRQRLQVMRGILKGSNLSRGLREERRKERQKDA